MPTDWFTGHELRETEESRGGQFYVCAGGGEIPYYGERTLTLSTLDWSSVRNMTFQVTDVTKALGSVSKIVAHGNKVGFDESGSFIENKRSRERLWMREENGVYVKRRVRIFTGREFVSIISRKTLQQENSERYK